MLLKKVFSSKSCFLILHVERKICSFYGVNWSKTWFFVCKFFFKIALFRNKFFFKIWRVVNLLIQKLTRCKIYDSKSAFQIIFSDSGWIIINVLPTCWKMTTAGCKIIFYECVVCVCLTFGTIFLLIAFFMAIGFLVRVMTISFALPIDLYKISLDFKKWLVYKDFLLKYTKLLS